MTEQNYVVVFTQYESAIDGYSLTYEVTSLIQPHLHMCLFEVPITHVLVQAFKQYFKRNKSYKTFKKHMEKGFIGTLTYSQCKVFGKLSQMPLNELTKLCRNYVLHKYNSTVFWSELTSAVQTYVVLTKCCQ